MTQYGEGLQNADARQVVSGVLDWLQQKPGNAQSTNWLKVCTQSAQCIKACPEGINAMKMVRVGQMSAMGSLGATPALSGRESKDFFRVINAFSQTQMASGDVEQWQR